MKSKRGLELRKKGGVEDSDGRGSVPGGDGRGGALGGALAEAGAATAGDGREGPAVKKAAADQGRQPEGMEDTNDRVIHNGSAGAFEASEDGHYEEDSDEDNDDFAMGR